MDWNEPIVVFCPPLLLVSPSDPTLTVENVREVMAAVENWLDLRNCLGVQGLKRQELVHPSPTWCLALGEYWVNNDPDASWERLANRLYQGEEEGALAVTKQYLQQCMCSS